MSVQFMKRLSELAKKHINGRKEMFIPAVTVLSFLVVGYSALDREAPIVETDTVKLAYGQKLDYSQIIVSDNRDQCEELNIEVDESRLNSNRVGSYNVPVKVTDRFMNETIKEVVVQVVDEVKPVFSVNVQNSNLSYEEDVIKVNVNSSNEIGEYINANDNADGDLTEFIDVLSGLDASVLGEQVVHLGVVDSSGNYATQQFKFLITDIDAPQISWNESNHLVVDYKSTFNITDYASIQDNSTVFEQLAFTYSNPIDTSVLGLQETTLSISDASNNVTNETVYVEVKDMSGPEILMPKTIFEVEVGSSFDLKSYIQAIDTLDGDMSNQVEIIGNMNLNVTGNYHLTVKVTDTAGNESTKSVEVKVKEPIRYGSNIPSNGSSVTFALTRVGCPYLSGGTGDNYFDCSGLTQWAYGKSGISIPRTSQAQYYVGAKVSLSELAPGDLVFFNTAGYLGHVGIYIGNGQMVHAGSSGVKVANITSSYWTSSYAGAVRY